MEEGWGDASVSKEMPRNNVSPQQVCRGLAQALPQPQKDPTCPHLDLGLLASRPGRQYILVIVSHQVCGPLLLQP